MKKIILALAGLAMCFTSCVKDEIYEGPASISNVAFEPGSVTPKDAVTVTATITDLQGVTSASVKYSINGGSAQSVNMTNSGNKYTGVIPAQADGSVVSFYVEANNVSGYTAKSDSKNYNVAAIIINYSGLQLNELNGNDKFIEIYNKGKETIPMEGVYIEKDAESNWVCDARDLAPGAYLLLYSEDVVADHPSQPAELIFHSGLSAKKAVRIQLFSPSGASLDDFNLTSAAKTAPASYSRNADGVWHYADATPGAANVTGNDPVQNLE